MNRQTKAKLLTRRQNLTNSANRNLKRSATQIRKTAEVQEKDVVASLLNIRRLFNII